jgi:hypothetical protein
MDARPKIEAGVPEVNPEPRIGADFADLSKVLKSPCNAPQALKRVIKRKAIMQR